MTHYSQNVVYTLLIDDKNYYIGSHCINHRPNHTYNDIVSQSGNPLLTEVRKKNISFQEYLDRIKLLSVEEFDDPILARKREDDLIKEYKNNYPGKTLNKRGGNPIYNKTRSPESNKKTSETMKGHSCSELTRKKMSEAKKGRPSNAKGCKHSQESILKAKESRRLTLLKKKDIDSLYNI